jgi:hypothetical protein
MRLFVMMSLLLLLAACQGAPGGGSTPGSRFDHGNRDGGMCSPYASGCW